MAVLGFHVVVCLVALTLFSKLASRVSFVSFFITNGLYRFIAPSNNELRALLPSSKEKNPRARRKKREEEESQGFNVPKSSEFQLKIVAVKPEDLQNFEMYSALHWLCLCVPICFAVYAICEVYTFVFPDNKDLNVSVILIMVAAGFVLQVMMTLTAWLVTNDDERGFMMMIAALYFLISCIFSMFADRLFDVQMLTAYEKLSSNIVTFVDSSGIMTNTTITDVRPDNPLFLYISLSIFFSVLSAMLVFPNFRCALLYLRAIETDGVLKRILDHIAFVLPALILVTFSLPVKYRLVDSPRKLMTSDQLDILRVYLVILWMILRFAVRVSHLQAHLNLSYEKVAQLQKQSGSVKNFAVQSMVLRYYSYICCASIQYFGPSILAALFAVLLKTAGGLSWLGTAGIPEDQSLEGLGPLRFVFDHFVCRQFFSFLVLVTLVINFSLSVMGVVYHNYLASN
ncbi:unnamed protein product [Caenorhabditis auriculariae]|uniref:Transmembrane protein n=1 Tax=Caenorhabditis auriculariae TaxID=2777116 RepID=A0A8S1HM54_9PELO|nr:unnamed protein product [Caenorhabditis auriculariae]